MKLDNKNPPFKNNTTLNKFRVHWPFRSLINNNEIKNNQESSLKGINKDVGIILQMPFRKQVKAEIDIHNKILKTYISNFGQGNNLLPALMCGMHRAYTGFSKPKKLEDKWRTLLNKALEDNNLSAEIEKQMYDSCLEYQDLWTTTKPGMFQGFFHEFAFTDNSPIRLPPRILPQKWQDEIEKQENKTLKDDIIETSLSPYRTNPVPAPKKVQWNSFCY